MMRNRLGTSRLYLFPLVQGRVGETLCRKMSRGLSLHSGSSEARWIVSVHYREESLSNLRAKPHGNVCWWRLASKEGNCCRVDREEQHNILLSREKSQIEIVNRQDYRACS